MMHRNKHKHAPLLADVDLAQEGGTKRGGSTWRSVARGATIGLAIAGGYTLIAILIYSARGAAPYTRNGVTVVGVVLFYAIAGIAAGATVGGLREVARGSTLAAYVVGLLAAIPVGFGATLLLDPIGRWDDSDWFTAGVGTLVCGLYGTWYFRKNPVRKF